MGDVAKCFKSSQEGEILGVCFNSIEMTWQMPERKKWKLIDPLRELITGKKKYKLREFQMVVGKLNDVKQLWQPGKFFMESVLSFTNTLLTGNECYPT